MTWEENNTLREKVFNTGNKLTYEEACEICKTPKRFLNYIRKHKDIYYKAGEFDKVESSLQYITGFIYGGEYCYSDYLDMIQEYFDEILPLGKEEDVEIYRGVKLESEDAFDWNNIGNCWTYDWDSAIEYLKYFQEDTPGYPFMISATTNRDNVDWILSICLNLTHINEKELRLYDESEIEDPYIEAVEEDQIN